LSDHALLRLNEVRFGFPSRPDFLGPVTLAVRHGECWGIVGPNGAGKSTLLRLMAGLYAAQSGEVSLDGATIASVPPRLRAKQLAWVPQHVSHDLALSAREVVLLGRFPHRALGLFETPGDHEHADQAMTLTDTTAFADRPMMALSGGEAQRVHLAAAIAQEPELLLLDEPTASLDLQHQLTIWRLLRGFADGGAMGVVVVTHDVNLAARFCTHLALMSKGKCVATGEPRDVVTPSVLEPVFGVKLVTLIVDTEAGDPPTYVRWIVPVRPLDEAPA